MESDSSDSLEESSDSSDSLEELDRSHSSEETSSDKEEALTTFGSGLTIFDLVKKIKKSSTSINKYLINNFENIREVDIQESFRKHDLWNNDDAESFDQTSKVPIGWDRKNYEYEFIDPITNKLTRPDGIHIFTEILVNEEAMINEIHEDDHDYAKQMINTLKHNTNFYEVAHEFIELFYHPIATVRCAFIELKVAWMDSNSTINYVVEERKGDKLTFAKENPSYNLEWYQDLVHSQAEKRRESFLSNSGAMDPQVDLITIICVKTSEKSNSIQSMEIDWKYHSSQNWKNLKHIVSL